MWSTVGLLFVRGVLRVLRLGPSADAKDIEIAVLRHQLAVLCRQRHRPNRPRPLFLRPRHHSLCSSRSRLHPPPRQYQQSKSASAASSMSVDSSAHESVSAELQSIVRAYKPASSSSDSSGAAGSSSAPRGAEEDRAARLARGVKIRRRIVRQMKKRLEAFAAANAWEIPPRANKKKEQTDKASATSSAQQKHEEADK